MERKIKYPPSIYFLGDIDLKDVVVSAEVLGRSPQFSASTGASAMSFPVSPTGNNTVPPPPNVSMNSVRSPASLFARKLSFSKRKSSPAKSQQTMGTSEASRSTSNAGGSMMTTATRGVTTTDTNTRSLSVSTENSDVQTGAIGTTTPQSSPSIRRSRGFSTASSPRGLLQSPTNLLRSFSRLGLGARSASNSSASNLQDDDSEPPNPIIAKLERILGSNSRVRDDLVDQLLSSHSDGGKQCRFVTAVLDLEETLDRSERNRRAKKIAEVFFGDNAMFRLRAVDLQQNISASMPATKLEPLLIQAKNIAITQLLQNRIVLTFLDGLTDIQLAEELARVRSPRPKSYTREGNENRESRHQSSGYDDEDESESKEDDDHPRGVYGGGEEEKTSSTWLARQ